jgi:hypothetical protein
MFHRGERLRKRTRAFAFYIPMMRLDLAWVSGKAKTQRRYDMNGRSHMRGGKNWILPKETNANWFF